MCCAGICWILSCEDEEVMVRAVVIFVFCGLVTGDDDDGFSLTITTPVPLQVVHLVTVVTFFFFGIFCTGSCIWKMLWLSALTSNLMSPSGETKICVGREFWAFASFWMQFSQRMSFGPLRFEFCWMWPPQVMHLCLSPFWWGWCCCCCCTELICSLIVWWSWAGSSDSELTIWICPKFCPLSLIKFWAWIIPGFWVTTVTVSLWESSWLWVLLCWFKSVKCEKIWLQTSHLKLIFDIVF